MTKKLLGKHAVITGCSRGIGRAILSAYAENGATIWACARSESDELTKMIRELKQDFGAIVNPIYFDITNSEQLRAGLRKIVSECGGIDVLVNNAGVAPQNKSFMMTTQDELKDIFQANFFSHMQIIQSVAKAMIRNKKGSIINITSIAATDTVFGSLEYVSSKAAFAAATKKLAEELAPYHIRVNAVAPGLTETDMVRKMSEGLQQEAIRKNFTGRLGKPEEIAQVAVFLASDESSYVNAQVIRVDGGF